MMTRLRSRHGFTLIELLVVIAIIAILAAILFPMFKSAKEQGKKASCGAQMGQIGKALIAYADDYNGRAPWATGYQANAPVNGVAQPMSNNYIVKVMLKYLGNKPGLWICPSNPFSPTDPYRWYAQYYYCQWAYSLPADPRTFDPKTAISGHLLTDTNWIGTNDQSTAKPPWTWKYTPMTKVPIVWDRRYDPVNPKTGQASGKYELLHVNGWNILFLDSHVKYHYEKDRSCYTPVFGDFNN